jgi:hypothetical protein
MATPAALGSQKDASIKLLNSINNAVLLASNKPYVFPVENKDQFKDLVKWLFTFQVEDFVSSDVEDFLKKLDEAADMASLLELKDAVLATKDPILFNKFNEKAESFQL